MNDDPRIQALRDKLVSLNKREEKAVARHTEDLDGINKERTTLNAQIIAETKRLEDDIVATWNADPQPGGRIDYSGDDFNWSDDLDEKRESVYGYEEWRPLQKEVCNAALDGRDVIYMAPTAGGKTLAAQLPVLMGDGIGIYVVPLKSLANDLHARDRRSNIQSAVYNGDVGREERDEIRARICATIEAKRPQPKLQILYITPEVLHAGSLDRDLGIAHKRKKFAYLIIDEAHCVTECTHRPDYAKMAEIRKKWPGVPVIALSATFTNHGLHDFIRCMKLQPLVNGETAGKNGTLCFVGDLVRPNLAYRVIPNVSKRERGAWITTHLMNHHRGHSGMICETTKHGCKLLAGEIQTLSNGCIRTAYYHADMPMEVKNKNYNDWYSGEVDVIICTTALGMGIDKSNVRFVIHSALAKSPLHYYQDSGRAGRDGQPAECIMLWSSSDFYRWSSIIKTQPYAEAQLRDMALFALELNVCRHKQFLEYFFKPPRSKQLIPIREGNPVAECKCDNCQRLVVDRRNMTVDAWRLLRVVNWMAKQGNLKLTRTNASLLVRGMTDSVTIDDEEIPFAIDEVCRSKSDLSAEAVEQLIIHLFAREYISARYRPNSYAAGGVNVYLGPGHNIREILNIRWENVLKDPKQLFIDFDCSGANFSKPRSTHGAHGGGAKKKRSRPFSSAIDNNTDKTYSDSPELDSEDEALTPKRRRLSGPAEGAMSLGPQRRRHLGQVIDLTAISDCE